MADFPSTSIAALAIAYLLFYLGQHWYLRNHPKSVGNPVGTHTNLWYLWKTWQGKFEEWNIRQHALHGKVIRVAPTAYSIDDPDAVKIIYGIATPMQKSRWYSAWGDPRVPNHNLFSSTDNRFHALMRRQVANLYSMTAIKSYEPYVEDCIRLLLREFDKFADSSSVFDLQHWMQCYALDVIGEISYSKQIGFLESGGKDVENIMAKVERSNMFSLILGTEFKLLPLLFLVYGNPAAAVTTIHSRLSKARQEANPHQLLARSAEDFETKLQALREKDPETFEQYRAGIATIGNIAAGSDTTSISLTGMLFHLIKNREAFSKLRQEVHTTALGESSSDNWISFDQAQKMHYLQLVLKEALRVHPATGLPMWRVVPKGGMEIAGQFFPGGTTVGINSWVAHRNTKVFGPDATQFQPERWDPTLTSADQLKSMEQYYLPFGAGSHTCIGKNISILEMSKLVPELVRRYDFELISPELEYVNHWFVKPKKVMVRIKRAIVIDN